MRASKRYRATYGRAIAVLSISFMVCGVASAQIRPEYVRQNESQEQSAPFINRWAFKTNVLEWVLTIPNIGLEFDLSASKYNRSTLGVTAKYNWNTARGNAPRIVFDYLDVRPEYRYYFRSLRKKDFSGNDRKPSVKYLGAYVNYGEYSFKLHQGIQGRAVGLGVSYGYALPVYTYNKGALDLDLGFSVGVQMTEYDRYYRDGENNCFAKVSAESEKWHVSPFPVVSELRVAFAWRPVSVKAKYLEYNPLRNQILLAESDIEAAFSDMKSKFGHSLDIKEREQYRTDAKACRNAFAAFAAETAAKTAENIGGYGFSKAKYTSLVKKIKRLERKSIRDFDRSIQAYVK